MLAALLCPQSARACGFDPEEEEARSQDTFDRNLLSEEREKPCTGEAEERCAGPCATRLREELLADWSRKLGPEIPAEEWRVLLFETPLAGLNGLVTELELQASASAKPPASLASSSVRRAARTRRGELIAALTFVAFARRVEPLARLQGEDDWSEAPKPPTVDGSLLVLQTEGDAALAQQTDPFLQQRYAFQLLRLRFYRRKWREVIAFHDRSAAVLAEPSQSLRALSLHYLAGALQRSGERARSSLALARIYASYPPLRAAAVSAFSPLEEKEWQETLALATTPEKVALYGLVGAHRDPFVALQKIAALEPRSDKLAPLLVRALERLERRSEDARPFERLALGLARRTGTDRPWLFWLAAAHAAALRGALPATRAELQAARSLRPGDALVEAQAHRTLAVALAEGSKGDAALREELAFELGELAALSALPSSETPNALRAVRVRLARSGSEVEAELLQPAGRWRDRARARWKRPAFIEALLARVAHPLTAFDRFAVSTWREAQEEDDLPLETELVLARLHHGEFAAAAEKSLAASANPLVLPCDPFAQTILDRLECPLGAKAQTLGALAARLEALRALSQGTGDSAAEASLQLGAALYNLTRHGNARALLWRSHNPTGETGPALAWFARAFVQAHSRELKARAAFFAARCELAQLLAGQPAVSEEKDVPIPAVWFPVVRTFADTNYHREILAECGHYRRWVARSR